MIDSEHIPLVLSWLQGDLEPGDKERLQQLLDKGDLDILDLKELERIAGDLERLPGGEPSARMGDRFYAMLAEEKARMQPSPAERLRRWAVALRAKLSPLRVGLAAAIFLAGLLAGSWTTPLQGGGELQRLQNEVAQMRQVMMLSLIDNGSATERLKAVNISSELNRPEPRVKEALIRTLNRDPNVNVRIAAVEALLMRASDPDVRSALVASIARQDSPLVQAALADAMLVLQEEGAIEELRELLRQEDMDATLRTKIQDTITKLS